MKNNETAQYIVELVKKHQVVYDENSTISQLAKKFIELADDQYLLDDIEELVVALTDAGIISVEEGGDLIYKYNKEAMKNSQ